MASRPKMNRAQMMAGIRSVNTFPERALREALWGSGLRYRKQLRVDGVRTDIAFVRKRVLIFIDGCFWHGCPEHFVLPRNNRPFWLAKLQENLARDRRQTQMLESRGWSVVRFWEHDVKADVDAVADAVRASLARTGTSNTGHHWRVADVSLLDEWTERRSVEDLRDPYTRRLVVRDTSRR